MCTFQASVPKGNKCREHSFLCYEDLYNLFYGIAMSYIRRV